ncbi:MAG: ThuA domain-containing protein [Pseudoxanthomonas sp.]
MIPLRAFLVIAALASFAPSRARAAETQAPAPAAYVKDPHFWPTPMMDTQAPALPQFTRDHAVLIFSKTNGFRHESIAASNTALAELVQAKGWDSYTTENAAVFNTRDLARFKVIVLNSASGDLFLPPQRAAFRQWLEQGGGLLALHGAGGDNSYAWDWYGDTVLGALFIGHPAHPRQFQQAMVHIEDRRHPTMQGLPDQWQREDEWYAFDRVPTGHGTRILATLDESTFDPPQEQRMGRHPIIWTRCVEKGRVFFSALGHQDQAWAEPLHRQMLGNALEWTAGANDEGCRP